MPRGSCLVLVLGALWALPGAAFAAKPVPAVDRMLAAAEQLSYAGNIVYVSGSQAVSLRLVHVVGRAGEQERLYSRDGRYWELRRAGSEIDLLVPPGSPTRGVICPIGGNFARVVPSRLKYLAAVYTIERVGTDRVSGRSADVWAVRPKDAHRYGLLLATDQSSGLLLRALLRSDDGMTAEQMFFPAVAIGGEAGGDIGDAIEKELAAAPGLVKQPISLPMPEGGWQAGWLPWGFAARSYLRGVRANTGKPFVQVVYSDGLTSISVFVEPLTAAEVPKTGLAGQGGLNVYAGVVQSHLVTVAGAAPALTLRLIGERMRRVEGVAITAP